MAISTNTAWEVRPTVGNDTNGGGFVTGASGTDFSQQNAKNTGGNNSSVADGVGAGSTTVLSATASFTAAIVGNVIFFDGLWYQVTVFNSSTSITVDRNTTTGTGLTLNVGGALLTVAAAIGTYTQGNTVWIKGGAGDYLVTTGQTLTQPSGSAQTPTTFRGYGTTRGDGVQAVWKTATDTIKLLTFQNLVQFTFRDIEFRSTATSPGELWFATSASAKNITCIGCKWNGGLLCIQGDFSVSFTFDMLVLLFCEITGSKGIGIANSFATVLYGCYIHDNVDDGCHLYPADVQTVAMISRTVFRANNSGSGGKGGLNSNGSDRPIILENCDFTDNTGDGVYLGSNGALQAVNCIFWNNSGFAVNAPGTQVYLVYLDACAFGSNGSGNFGNIPNVVNAGPVTITVDPFTNQSTGDFSLNSTVGGGASCKQAGVPTAMP